MVGRRIGWHGSIVGDGQMVLPTNACRHPTRSEGQANLAMAAAWKAVERLYQDALGVRVPLLPHERVTLEKYRVATSITGRNDMTLRLISQAGRCAVPPSVAHGGTAHRSAWLDGQ
jgi:hypothetical protein